MHSLDLFTSFVEAHRYWGYGVLFLAMMVEGELFLTAVGMMVRIHAFDYFDALFFALAGVLSGDVLWYWTGALLKSKYPYHKLAIFVVNRVRKHLPTIENNPFHVIFLSKFIYGLNHSTLVVLGFFKIPFVPFLRVQILASLIWSVLFLTLGYMFGSAAIALTRRFDFFLLIALMALIVVAIVSHRIGRVIGNSKRNEKDREHR